VWKGIKPKNGIGGKMDDHGPWKLCIWESIVPTTHVVIDCADVAFDGWNVLSLGGNIEWQHGKMLVKNSKFVVGLNSAI